MLRTLIRHKLIIIVGHYGSGKTNVAVNMALELRKTAPEVTLIDLDIVNPYFRAADVAGRLHEAGIHTIIPEFANTNVDVPALPASINSVFDTLRDAPETAGYYIFDVGGDDGAVALGMYKNRIEACGYDMFCVVNRFRPLIAKPADAVADLREIEDYARLTAGGIINNSCIGVETVPEDIRASIPYGQEVARLAGLPLLFTSYIRHEGVVLPDTEAFFPMVNATKQMF